MEIFDGDRVAIMAVVNRTPNSFYDRGATFVLEDSVAAAVRAVRAGAHWVDIGGVPFGRGPEVTVDEEMDRVVPLVNAVRQACPDTAISIDTYRSAVARAAVGAGANIVNDTSGFSDPDMVAVIAATGAYTVVCHSAGRPREEKPAAHYTDVVAQVREFFADRVARLRTAGVDRERIILDPGHDLDKNTLHTLELTRRFHELTDLGFPLLAAVSNKDFVGESTGRPQGQRLAGSLAAMTACVLAGARAVRMHDIEPTVDAVHMAEAILNLREPFYMEHNTHPTHNV